MIGKHVSTYYPADYLLRREREIIPALRRREHWQGEQMMVFPDGQMHPTIHSIFPVQDENGELLYAAAVITDITELAETEEALRQSYEELRASEERFELVVRGIRGRHLGLGSPHRKGVLLAPLEDAIRLRRERDRGQLRGLGQPSSSG